MYVLRRCHGRGLLVGSKPPMASEVRRGRGASSAERRAVRSILVVMIRTVGVAGMSELPSHDACMLCVMHVCQELQVTSRCVLYCY